MTDSVIGVFEVLAAGIVNGFWISLLLMGLAAGVLRLIERRRPVNASTRYGVWIVTLVAVAAAHVVGAGVPVVGDSTADRTVVEEQDRMPMEVNGVDARGADELPAPVPLERVGRPDAAPDSETYASSEAVAESSPLPPVEVESARSSVDPGAGSAFSIDVSGGFFLLSALLILVWFSRATAGLGSVISSWRRVVTLKSNARTLNTSLWRDLAPATLRRTFSVAESEDVSSPVAAGLIAPMILVPAGLRDRLTTDEFRQVLLHEIAHLERFDDWTILLQRIVEAVLWHHPAVWRLSNELQEAREISCDDWVVSRTRRPEAYVHSIGRMIELNLGTRSLQLAPGLAAGRGDLMGRMRRILSGKLPESSRLSGEQFAVAGGLIGLVLVLVAVFIPLTRLVFSFGDGEAVTYVFGGGPDEAVRIQEVPTIERIPPLAPLPALPELPPLPALPELPPLPDLPFVPLSPDSPPPAPRAATVALREKPPPPPVSARADAPPAAVSDTRVADADLSVHSWIRILDSAAGISSNGERMEVLRTALEKMPDDDRVVRAWIDAVNRMTSSGSRSELLVQLVNTVQLDSDRIDRIRSAAASIPSRGDRERVLRALSDKL